MTTTLRLPSLAVVLVALLAISNIAPVSSGQNSAQTNSVKPESKPTSAPQSTGTTPATNRQNQAEPEASTGTSGLFTLSGSGAPTTSGDYVSASGALNTSYRYFVEVPPGLGRLVVDLFDADIGLGGTAEATAGRDRDRSGFNTSATYSLINPAGQGRNVNFTSGDDTTPVGADNAWLPFFDSTGDNVADNFSSVAYNRNDGSVNWAGDWVETNDDNNPNSGRITITGGELSITDNGGAPSTIEREANLLGQGFSTATLSFNFRTQNVAAGDQMRVEVSNNGGASWNTLETFTGPFAVSSRSYNISAFIATNTRVRFIEVSGYTGSDTFFVDNLQIKEGGIDAGHWELRVNMSSAVTNGDDINALGIRAHDGTAGIGGIELNTYVDSLNGFGANPPATGTNSRSYTFYPYITSGCSCSENDFDFDSNRGNTGSVTFTSPTATFTQTFSSAALSADNVWKRNSISGWTTDATSSEYGIWTGNLTIGSYVVGTTPNGNYADVYLTNYQAAANPPSANPAANAFRLYLPTDSGVAPVKPFVRQRALYAGGANPPTPGQSTQMLIVIDVVNPTGNVISFSAANLVTANVPGSSVVYAGSPQQTQGTIVSQPAIGGTGNITWNPGALVAGGTATLTYLVSATPTLIGQRLVITGTPASGNGTRAQYVDETGNTTQARSTFLFGPLCELAITVGLPTAAPASISGQITTADGQPLGGAIVSLAGGATDTTITDSSGRYRFDGVDTDAFYVITPARANYSFTPASRAFSLLGDRNDAVFTANLGNETQNPVDDNGFLVRQQYLDFLSREPDQGGWRYWTDQLADCGTDSNCISAQRVAVSAAFFDSQEFQETGSFVYRLYRAGLGRRLSYAEFSQDRTSLVAGPSLEQSKVSFEEAFVQRPEFLARYSSAHDTTQFVDQLIASVRNASGLDLSDRRQALMSLYDQGSNVVQSRLLVIRAVVDDSSFVQSEYNAAFVLMDYFGYLRRDPDQAGYDFWLDILNNREPNNYQAMVCAFLTSAEYQRRFSSAVTRSDSECQH